MNIFCINYSLHKSAGCLLQNGESGFASVERRLFWENEAMSKRGSTSRNVTSICKLLICRTRMAAAAGLASATSRCQKAIHSRQPDWRNSTGGNLNKDEHTWNHIWFL
jgi:hypothetical protein